MEDARRTGAVPMSISSYGPPERMGQCPLRPSLRSFVAARLLPLIRPRSCSSFPSRRLRGCRVFIDVRYVLSSHGLGSW